MGSSHSISGGICATATWHAPLLWCDSCVWHLGRTATRYQSIMRMWRCVCPGLESPAPVSFDIARLPCAPKSLAAPLQRSGDGQMVPQLSRSFAPNYICPFICTAVSDASTSDPLVGQPRGSLVRQDPQHLPILRMRYRIGVPPYTLAGSFGRVHVLGKESSHVSLLIFSSFSVSPSGCYHDCDVVPPSLGSTVVLVHMAINFERYRSGPHG
jgi:hypothetical protein